LGEILCFLGEAFIGLVFFDWKPFKCRGGIIEKVCPLNENSNRLNSENNFLTRWLNKIKEIICGTNSSGSRDSREDIPYLLIQDFSRFSTSENPVLEISEVHFVLSRVLAGLGTLNLIALLGLLQNSHPKVAFLLTLPSLLCLLGCIIALILKSLRIKWLHICCLLFIISLIFLAFLYKEHKILLLVSSLLIGSLYFAIIYRTHTNKLLYYSTRNRNNRQPPNENRTPESGTSS